MTEVDMVAALGTLVGDRVFPDTADLGEPMPLILYQQVGGRALNFLDSSTTDIKQARMQISVVSKNRAESKLIITQVENLLVLAPFLARVEGAAVAYHEAPTEVRGFRQDFTFWFDY